MNDRSPPPPAGGGDRCLNCEAVLTGEYCSRCGQHVHHHVHSTPEMIGEFIEDLLHADHRIWRTLKPLLFRPGLLTAEYLRGRRVSYTSPFRLYIVLSLIFFLSASLSGSAPQVVVPTGAPIDATAPDEAADATIDPDYWKSPARTGDP